MPENSFRDHASSPGRAGRRQARTQGAPVLAAGEAYGCDRGHSLAALQRGSGCSRHGSGASSNFSIIEFSTLPASFEEDLHVYAEAGFEGIGICEIKLQEGREAEQLEAFRASGLRASCAVPAVPSIFPIPPAPSPQSPEERIEAMRAGMRRLAPFEPAAFVCLTGWPSGGDEEAARSVVVAGLQAVGEEAERLGIPVGLEPASPHFRIHWTVATTLAEAAELIDEAGSDALGLTFDTWHLWDSPGVAEEIKEHAARIVCVHVADWRKRTRGWCDRGLPGDGAADIPGLVHALEEAGWNGFYDLEIFSDNGVFGDRYPDSLWDVPPAELARRGRESLQAAWQRAVV